MDNVVPTAVVTFYPLGCQIPKIFAHRDDIHPKTNVHGFREAK